MRVYFSKSAYVCKCVTRKHVTKEKTLDKCQNKFYHTHLITNQFSNTNLLIFSNFELSHTNCVVL